MSTVGERVLSVAEADIDEPNVERVRASDTERELLVEQLTRAVGRGMLSLAEIDERTSAAYTTVTRAELAELTRDLPGYSW